LSKYFLYFIDEKFDIKEVKWMADTMKFLWGANSKIPTGSSTTNGKAYFAIIDNGYTDTAAPTNEAFIYLDKAGARYNVIAKRAIFDSLGNKITNKYFSEVNHSSGNTIKFFTAEQDPSKDTPMKSAAIITAIDLSNSSVTANEYKIKTIINGFEDKTTDTNSTLSLGMATGTLAGLVSAGE
jgi:aspartokinase